MVGVSDILLIDSGQGHRKLSLRQLWWYALLGLKKKAPTCYRALRWPDADGIIREKYRQKGRNSGIPRKYPKMPKNTQTGHFWYFGGVFFGILGLLFGVHSGSPEFRALGVFFGFFRGNSGRAISGLCSRSGRSQAWPCSKVFKQFRLVAEDRKTP